jgi:hypothetical protein
LRRDEAGRVAEGFERGLLGGGVTGAAQLPRREGVNLIRERGEGGDRLAEGFEGRPERTVAVENGLNGRVRGGLAELWGCPAPVTEAKAMPPAS